MSFMDSMYLEGVEYVSFRTFRLMQGTSARVVINDTSQTYGETPPRLIVALSILSNKRYVISLDKADSLTDPSTYYIHEMSADVLEPELVSDDTPTGATTGDPFGFSIAARDNVGVVTAWIDYWTNLDSTQLDITLTLASGTAVNGRWTGEITIPSNVNLLYYEIYLKDGNTLMFISPAKTVPVTDNDLPVFGTDTSPTAGTTGDPFDFSVSVSDNIGVSEVHVEYWYGGGTHTNRTLTGTDTYHLEITIPSTSTDSLNYFFSAVDAAGSWAWLPEMTVPIKDNDLPSIDIGVVPDEGTTGEKVEFHPDITDNIAVANAYVEYWFGEGGHFNVTLASADDYKVTIDLPMASTDPLHLFLSAVDAAENWQKTETFSVLILDNDPPTFGTDSTPNEADLGEKLTFSTVVSDNIGVTSVYVDYWYGTGARTNMSMGGTGTYSLEITITSETVDTLNYQFKAVDAAGNWMDATIKTITFQDKVLPTLGADASDTVAVQGKDFVFKVQASDNIEVAAVKVKYRFGSDAFQEKDMTGGPTEFTFTVSVPLSETRPLGYIFTAFDTSDNTVSSQEYTRTPVDRTKPGFVSDDSDQVLNEGQEFEFIVKWEDNVDIAEAFVVYWYEGAAESNVSMVLSGTTFKYTMTVPDGTKGTLNYKFKAKDAAGNWATSTVYELQVTPKPVKEEKGLGTGLLAAIILVVILVVILLLYVAMRKGKAPAEATTPPPPAPVVAEAPVETKGAVGASPAAQAVAPPPPTPAVAPVAVAAAASAPAGRFRVLNVKAQCASCGTQIDRGSSAYVCSCGAALHEKCAAKVRACPNCKAEIRFG